MIRDQDSRCAFVERSECPHDCVACILLVFSPDFIVGHDFGDWYRAMKVVSMSRAETWDWPSGLGPCGCALRVRMSNPSDRLVCFVEHEVSGQVRGRAQLS